MPFVRRHVTLPLALLLALCHLPAQALENVTVQLKWRHQFQFAGYYAALDKGFYREAGLNVLLLEGSPVIEPIAEVVEGRADFGISNASLLPARAAGKPVVAVAAIFQHSPNVILARQTKPTESVHDLVGRRVMIEQDSAELLAYLRREGISPGQLKMVRHTFATEDLLDGRVDALSAYVTDEPYTLRQAGVPFVTFTPRTQGIDFYGDTLFTRDALIEQKPELVEAFRAATLKGWRYAMQHPEEIIELLQRRYKARYGVEQLRFEAARTHDLIQPDIVELGYMNQQRWQAIAETYASTGMIQRAEVPAGLLYTPPHPAEQRSSLLLGILAPVLTLLLVSALAYAWINLRLRRENRQRSRETAQLRDLLDAIPAALMVTTQQGEVRYANAAMLRLLGSPREEVVGRPAREFLEPDERIRFAVELAEQTSVRNFETRIHGAHSETARWVSIDGISTRLAGEAVVLTATTDIDARKTAEQALTRSLAENLELQAHLREQALHDPLTGLFNRRYLEKTLDREVARASREGGKLAVVMLDLDYFKAFNDQYGHAVGDQLLMSFARLLESHIREGDVACRYGGEEFTLIMPGLTAETASQRLEVLRQACRELPAPSPLSVSAGCALYPSNGRSAARLLAAADAALYQAKQQGRNRICLASERATSGADEGRQDNAPTD